MRVGEYVVCIYPGPWSTEAFDGVWDTGPDPVLNEVYQITDLKVYEGELFLAIDLQDKDWFSAEAFRPVAYGPLPTRKIKEPIA